MLVTLVGCGGTKTKPTNATVQDIQELKNTIIEGSLTPDEKKKVVELTQTVAKVGIDTDYTKDTLDTVKAFFKYTTDDIEKNFSEDVLNKMLNGQKVTKQIIKVEGVTFNKVSKDSEDKITVDCTLKVNVQSHTDPNLNGKTFSNVTARYIFNKEWKITAYAVSDFQ